MIDYEKNAPVDGIQLKMREERVEDKMKLSSKRKLSHMFDSIRLSHEAHGIKIKNFIPGIPQVVAPCWYVSPTSQPRGCVGIKKIFRPLIGWQKIFLAYIPDVPCHRIVVE